MGSDNRVVSLAARKADSDAKVDARLARAYEDAKARDDGRRVRRADLTFAERERL